MPADADKLTEELKLRLSERVLRELQDLALDADRSVTDYVRHVLNLHLYGHGRIVRRNGDKG